MFGEPCDDVEGEIGALKLRIGVDHHGNVDRVRDGAKVGFDLRVVDREIRLHDRQDAVGAKLLVSLRLRHRIRGRCRSDAGDHRHAFLRGFDGRLHHRGALLAAEIGELAGRAERRQPVHAGLDQIVAEPAEHVGADLSRGVDRRDQIGKDAVEISHNVRFNLICARGALGRNSIDHRPLRRKPPLTSIDFAERSPHYHPRIRQHRASRPARRPLAMVCARRAAQPNRYNRKSEMRRADRRRRHYRIADRRAADAARSRCRDHRSRTSGPRQHRCEHIDAVVGNRPLAAGADGGLWF